VPAQAPPGFSEIVNGAVAAGFMIETGDKPISCSMRILRCRIWSAGRLVLQRGTPEVRLTEAATNRTRQSALAHQDFGARQSQQPEPRTDEVDKILKNDLRDTVVGPATAKPNTFQV
jgi:hypothetical protein